MNKENRIKQDIINQIIFGNNKEIVVQQFLLDTNGNIPESSYKFKLSLDDNLKYNAEKYNYTDINSFFKIDQYNYNQLYFSFIIKIKPTKIIFPPPPSKAKSTKGKYLDIKISKEISNGNKNNYTVRKIVINDSVKLDNMNDDNLMVQVVYANNNTPFLRIYKLKESEKEKVKKLDINQIFDYDHIEDDFIYNSFNSRITLTTQNNRYLEDLPIQSIKDIYNKITNQ